jgi:hypothetical protein
MSGRHENGHGAAAAAAAAAVAAGGGGGGRAGDGGGDAHEDDLVMPGFRFHPTEEELIEFYLRRKVEGKRFNVELITFLDLYRYDPWELPGLPLTPSANTYNNNCLLSISSPPVLLPIF